MLTQTVQPVDHSDRSRLLRGLSGLLAIAAATPVLLLPFTLPVIVRVGAELIVVAFILRASVVRLKAVWYLGAAAFGFLTIGMATNEFHGKPPLILHFLIAWWAASFVLSVIGLCLDNQRPKLEAYRRENRYQKAKSA
jgi:hypothetical protein